MTKYVISQFTEDSGIIQEVVKAETKLEAFLDYLDVTHEDDRAFFQDVESLLSNYDLELGYDINIIKVSKRPKWEDPDYSPWPFPTARPE